MIEINWGKPLHLVITEKGDVQKFSTIEQAQHWLQAKWPVSDEARQAALQKIEDAMQCIGSVGTARRGFLQAAASAGFALSPVEA